MIAEARLRGGTLPLVDRNVAIYDDAASQGWGSRDGSALPSYWPTRNPG